MVHVCELVVYPVKACGGVGLDKAELIASGFRYDRLLVVTSAKNGERVTQITLPKIASIRTQIAADHVVLSAGGLSDLALPLSGQDEGSPKDLKLWREDVVAFDQGERAAQWFSDALGQEVRLVRKKEGQKRKNPLLVISQASLAELNRRMDKALPMNRFRPNIVIDGLGPFGEDELKRFNISSMGFEKLDHCARCAYTTVDQDSGIKSGVEPLKTLSLFRNFEDGLRFGTYFANDRNGFIQVGDPLVLPAHRSMESLAT
jgi:uncharacterized protein YcbX